MQKKLSITYLQNHEIDREKWDRAIDAASNGLIYGYSWYLDAMADHWDALVLDDYVAVMPLPWRKKFSFRYIYQPFLTAQLGIFGSHLTEDLITSFLSSIPTHFQLWEFSLNPSNNTSSGPYLITTRTNYTLDLNKPYEELKKRYRENLSRTIKKAEKYGCTLKENIPVNFVIELAQAHAGNYSGEDMNHFAGLYKQLTTQKQATTYGVYLNEQLLASAAFIYSHQRAYYILVGNHPNGRTLGASHFLLDQFIRRHAEQQLLLDFEGSDIRSLAFFYSSFGAVAETYPAVRYNRLPWWIRWLKK